MSIIQTVSEDVWRVANCRVKARIRPANVTIAAGDVVQFDMTGSQTASGWAAIFLPSRCIAPDQYSFSYNLAISAANFIRDEDLTVGGVVIGAFVSQSKTTASTGTVVYIPAVRGTAVLDTQVVTGSQSGFQVTVFEPTNLRATPDRPKVRNAPFNIVRREVGGSSTRDALVYGIAQRAGVTDDRIAVDLLGTTAAKCLTTSTVTAISWTSGATTNPNIFFVGNTITQAVTLATGTVLRVLYNGSAGYLILSNVTGTFDTTHDIDNGLGASVTGAGITNADITCMTIGAGDFCDTDVFGTGLLVRRMAPASIIVGLPGISPVARALENAHEYVSFSRAAPDANGPFEVGELVSGSGGERGEILEVSDPSPGTGAGGRLHIRINASTAAGNRLETFSGAGNVGGLTTGAAGIIGTVTAAPSLVMFNGIWGIGATMAPYA